MVNSQATEASVRTPQGISPPSPTVGIPHSVLNIRSNGSTLLALPHGLLSCSITRSGPTVARASLAADADAQVPATATASGVRATVPSCATPGARITGDLCVSSPCVVVYSVHVSYSTCIWLRAFFYFSLVVRAYRGQAMRCWGRVLTHEISQVQQTRRVSSLSHELGSPWKVHTPGTHQLVHAGTQYLL